jgi:hypothetical protein
MRAVACLPEKPHGLRAAVDGITVIIAIGKMRCVDEDPVGCKPVRTVIRPVPVHVSVGAIGIVPVGGIDFGAGKEFAIRRHWKPAHIAVAVTPQHPGGSPDIARDPQPAVSRIENPSSVMKWNIAPTVIGHPDPTIEIGIVPVALAIGAEIGHLWLPHIAPAWVMEPSAIRP